MIELTSYVTSQVCDPYVFLKKENSMKGEMYEGKYYPLAKNLTYFLEEFTYVFLPLEIKVSFFKPQKYIFSRLISRNGTFEVTFPINF